MSAAAVQPAPFDEIAAIYDEVFTHSLIGQAQRESVWKEIDGIWKSGDHVLELNCGTGEDALHLAERGINITGCDASAAMIEVANEKKLRRSPDARIGFVAFPTEHIGRLSISYPFDGVFSNFSGLNCVADLSSVARQLATLVRPGAELVLVFSTRFSLWEFLWYAFRGEFSKATRRWSGHVASSISGRPVDVWYPRVPQIRSAFAPHFQFVSVTGIGVAIPPSYVESWAQQHRRTFSVLASIDNWINHLSCFRVAGDHMLLRFRRSS
jgi:SAM-dependent methyltransferase